MGSFLSRIREEPLPFFYIIGRVDMLTIAIVSTVFWGVMGWDSTIDQLFGSPYGVGIHWSTIQNFALVFYVLTMNLNIGGISSAKQFFREVWKDLRSIPKSVEFFRPRKQLDSSKKVEEFRSNYASRSPLGPTRAACFVLCFTVAALFIFELIWVPLYDYFQFGNWLWPVYMAVAPIQNSALVRNVGMVFPMLFLGVASVYFVWDEVHVSDARMILRRRFSVSWRFDGFWLVLIVITWLGWVAWIYWPHSIVTVIPSQVIWEHPFNATYFASQTWILPSQGLFPQTQYTFYPASAFLRAYPVSEIPGFYVSDPILHAVNVTVKYLVFMCVCYPAMVVVKRRGSE